MVMQGSKLADLDSGTAVYAALLEIPHGRQFLHYGPGPWYLGTSNCMPHRESTLPSHFTGMTFSAGQRAMRVRSARIVLAEPGLFRTRSFTGCEL